MIELIVVDSKTEGRDRLIKVLTREKDIKVTGIGGDGFDALRLSDKLKPDIAILEMEMPIVTAAKVSSSLKARSPETAIISITKEEDHKRDITLAARHGFEGLVPRSAAEGEIVRAVRGVMERGHHMSEQLAAKAMRVFGSYLREEERRGVYGEERQSEWAEREWRSVRVNRTELRIAGLVGEGLSNTEIAKELKLKEGTVRNNISTLLQKAELTHRTQLALYAFGDGYIERVGGARYGRRRRQGARRASAGEILEAAGNP
jgi:DNA-binding NarL/FixJ family response regulator